MLSKSYLFLAKIVAQKLKTVTIEIKSYQKVAITVTKNLNNLALVSR